MSSAHANTNPEELRRRLQSNGPFGFVQAVYQTLKRLNRPYYYSASVPPWFGAKGTEKYEEAFRNAYQAQHGETQMQETPHAIIHTYRQYPAKKRYSGTSDSPSGARREKTPTDVFYHSRPLPSSDSEDTGKLLQRPALTNGRRQHAPLWDSTDQIPDLIRDHVDEDTVCYVDVRAYDVFVDFTLAAANMYLLEQMHSDLMLILRTFHDRAHTGASNLSGWFYQSVSGASPGLDLKSVPTRTITWRLKQTEAYAFPAQTLEDIRIDLYGE